MDLHVHFEGMFGWALSGCSISKLNTLPSCGKLMQATTPVSAQRRKPKYYLAQIPHHQPPTTNHQPTLCCGLVGQHRDADTAAQARIQNQPPNSQGPNLFLFESNTESKAEMEAGKGGS